MRFERKRFAPAVIALALLSVAPPGRAQSSTPTEFGEPVMVFLSPTQGQYIVSASLAVDKRNTIYLAFDVNVTQFDTDFGRVIRLARSEDGGITWTVKTIAQGQVRFPRLATGPNNELYLLYLQGLFCGAKGICDAAHLTFPSVQMIKSGDGGDSFSSAVQISSPGMTAVETGEVELVAGDIDRMLCGQACVCSAGREAVVCI